MWMRLSGMNGSRPDRSSLVLSLPMYSGRDGCPSAAVLDELQRPEDSSMSRLWLRAAGFLKRLTSTGLGPRRNAQQLVEATLTQYFSLSQRMWNFVLSGMAPITGNVQEHVALLNAIIDGDADLAAAIAEEHVTHFEELVRSAL